MWAAGYTDEAGTEDMDEILKLLIDRGARLDDSDNRGRTALMIAAALGHKAVPRYSSAAAPIRRCVTKSGKRRRPRRQRGAARATRREVTRARR